MKSLLPCHTPVPLWETVVGSNMWGAARPDSDVDVFRCYLGSSVALLLGKRLPKGRHTMQSDGITDTVAYELGHVMNALCGGNINFILGVLSPHVVSTSGAHAELVKITQESLSKATYYSIDGLARSLMQRGPHRRQLATRLIGLGVRLLDEGRVVFGGEPLCEVSDIERGLVLLREAHEGSSLPDHVSRDPFERLLLFHRVLALDSELGI